MDPKFFYKSNDVTRITFELLDNPMIEELTCCICLEIFNKPTQTECSHRFCKRCITKCFGLDRGKNCPICRTNILKANLKHDPFAESIISKLKVKCSEKSCTDTFTVNDIKKHIDDECEYASRECKFNCGKKFIKKNIVEHENGCFYNPTVEINCERCNERIFAVNLIQHNKKTCPETEGWCEFGCKDSVKRKDLTPHYDEFAKIHADKMLKILKEYKILHERSIEKDKIMDLTYNGIINEINDMIKK